MAQSDLYAILGVTKTANAKEIKRAYRDLARKYHPDHNPNNPRAEARFKEVSAAFDILGDEKKRSLYDEFGPDGLREGFNPDAARQWGTGGFSDGQFSGNFQDKMTSYTSYIGNSFLLHARF